MKPVEKEKLADFLTLGDRIGDMVREHAQMVGGSNAMTAGLKNTTGHVFGNNTDYGRWDGVKRNQFTQMIGRPLEGGVVREPDFKRYYESYIPGSGDTSATVQSKVTGLVDYASAQYRNYYTALAAAGTRGIERLPSPEEYTTLLKQRAGQRAAYVPPGAVERQ
jgi:hypothetical protein